MDTRDFYTYVCTSSEQTYNNGLVYQVLKEMHSYFQLIDQV